MRLVTFQPVDAGEGSTPRAGIVSGDQIVGLGTDMLSVIAAGRWASISRAFAATSQPLATAA